VSNVPFLSAHFHGQAHKFFVFFVYSGLHNCAFRFMKETELHQIILDMLGCLTVF